MQSRNQSIIVRLSAILAATLSLAMLSGCSVAKDAPPTNYNAPIEMAGLVLAGRNYMEYASIKIYETQPTGVATNGTYVGPAKLIGQATTSVTGTWTVDNVTCASPDQLYVTAEGGTPMPYYNNYTSLSNNPNSLMMTAVGDCSTLTNEDNPRNTTQIITNEASSIAAVWALRPFISMNGTTVNITSDATNYGGTSGLGVIGNYAGLAHAFVNANNLNPFRQGAFATFTNGATNYMTGGIVPVQTLNALAYIQYLCTIGAVDGKTAGDFTLCTQLYQLATPPAGGTAPTNSLQAMLNIANHPTNNAAGLMTFAQSFIPGSQALGLEHGGESQANYGSPNDPVNNDPTSSSPGSHGIGPFIPALTSFCSAPGACSTQDWTVAVYYGPGIGGNTLTGAGAIQPSTVPIYLSLDADDNVYFSNPSISSASTQANVMSLQSNGSYRWGSLTDYTVNVQPRELAPDQFGNLWVTGGSTTAGQNVVQEFDTATGALKNTFQASNTNLWGLAVDSLGNIWYTNNSTTGLSLHEMVKNNGYVEMGFTVPPIVGPTLQVRPDSKNNIWVAGYGSSGTGSFLYFPNTSGDALHPAYTVGIQSAPLTGSGIGTTFGVAIDANGNAYATNNNATAGGPGTLYKATVANPTSVSATISDTSVISLPEYNAADQFQGGFMDTDGAGTIWLNDHATGTWLYSYAPSTNTLTSFYPCFANLPQTGVASPGPGTNFCNQSSSSVTGPTSGISTRYDEALDSTGSLWVASYGNSGGGRIVQIISPAAPTVPLKALGKIGVMP